MAASSFHSIYFDMFGQRGVDPVFIPTGMDEDLVPQPMTLGTDIPI